MSKRAWMLSFWILGIGTVVLTILGMKFGLGYLLGGCVGLVNYKRNETFWSAVLSTGHAKRGTGFTHFLVNYGLMAGVLAVGVMFPAYVNIFTAALGLMIIKLAAVAELFFTER